MKLGVFAKTFPGSDPATVLAACAAAGFESCQYNMACSGLTPLPLDIDDAAAISVAAAARDTGVAIAAVSATYNMLDPDPLRREAGRRSFRAIARRAMAMGARIVTVCSGSRDPDDQWRHHPDNARAETWTDMCREFERLLAIASDCGIVIGVEPEPANAVSSARRAQELLAQFAGAPIGIVLDPANLLDGVSATLRHRTVEEAFAMLGPSVILAHAKDRDEAGQVCMPGTGIVDWPAFVGGLRTIGFDGHLVAHGMSAAESAETAARLRGHLEGRG